MDDSSDKTITFNEKGECNYCTEQLANIGKVYFPNAEGKKKLDDMIDMLDYIGALYTDEVDEACVALTTIKLYIQSSVPRAE